jgi:NitT/TauT family transport system substrate-binding protein
MKPIAVKTLVLCMLGIIYASTLQAQELFKISYMPHWSHQAQFAGYYMALEKGIYEKYGLDVKILDGGPSAPMDKVFENNLADFGSDFLSGAIKIRSGGTPIVNIAQLSQMSALIFVAKKKSGIDDVNQFNGKKIGIWRSGFTETPMAFLNQFNINAQIVPITSTINLFLNDGIDIMCVMWYNEYNRIYNSGINFDELNTFFFNDYGFDIPEDGIYCSESFYEEHPEVCEKFVDATIEGWYYAFAHEDETLDLVLKIMHAFNISANRSHQRWMLERMKDIFITDDGKISGKLKKEDYLKTAKILKNSGAIDAYDSFENFYKGDH